MEELFKSLLYAQSEDEVHQIINRHPKLKEQKNWKPYGNTTGNYSSFENQQTTAEAALMEKIMNSIDHSLIKQCLIKGINPSSAEAPMSMDEAKKTLYTEDELENEQILLIVDGEKDTPNIIIMDEGEGQVPDNFENTLLSLQRGNKNSVKFVQGKFNMGSTGAVVFCGKHKYQLIISKRHSQLAPTNTEIGFTLVRKHVRTAEEFESSKSTWYEYFTIDNQIPRVKEQIVQLPGDNKFIHGTLVKLYNYQLKRKTQAFQSLKEDINRLLYYPAFPVDVHETRKCFESIKNREKGIMNKAKGNGILLEGYEDKLDYKSIGNKLEGPVFGEANIDIFVFKEKEKTLAKTIRGKQSIVFLMNGQVQYQLGTSYVSSTLGFKLIKEHLVAIIDCTNLKREFHDEGFFMANRESIKDTEETKNFLNAIRDFLQGNEDLIELNKRRASEKISSNGTKELFERLLGKSKQDNFLKNLFHEDSTGSSVQSSRNSKSKTKKEDKNLKEFPSNVLIRGIENGKGKFLSTRLGGKSTITLDIDANDDYFRRSESPGELVIKVSKKSSRTTGEDVKTNGETIVNDWFNISQTDLQNGEMKISLTQQNEQIAIGDEFQVDIRIVDEKQMFNQILSIKIDKPVDKKAEKEVKKKERLILPPVIQVFKDQEVIDGLSRTQEEKESYKTWEELEWDQKKGETKVVEIIPGTTENEVASGIYINMSSNALRRIIQEEGTTGTAIEQAQEQFLTGIYMQSFLIAAAINRMQHKSKDQDDNFINQIEMENLVASIIEEIAYASVKMQINNIKVAMS